MFIDCKNLDMRHTGRLHRLLDDCEYLTGIKFSYDACKAAVDIGNMFSGCIKLASVDLSEIVTDNTFYLSFQFSECKSLEEVDVSMYNTRKVIYINGMFQDCVKLRRLDLSNFDTRKVQSAQDMFRNCKSLEWLNISSFNLANLRSDNMRGMFHGCTSLRKVLLPEDKASREKLIEQLKVDGIQCEVV